jgi:hypothetical protein
MVEQMLQVFGVGIWLATALGTLFLFRAGHSKSAILLWSWIISGLLFLSFLTGEPNNQKRYGVYFAPPVYLLAASVLLLPLKSRALKGLSAAFLLVAAAPGIAAGVTLRHPVVNGYADVADFVSSLETKAPVMFCCKHDGTFVFYMRQNDPVRKSVTLRADKILISTVVHLHRGVIAHTTDADDVLESLQNNGVGYLVLEDKTLEGVAQFEHLRSLAETAGFERLKDFRIDSSEPAYDEIKVGVFRNKATPTTTGTTVTIPFPHLGRSIQLDVGR